MQAAQTRSLPAQTRLCRQTASASCLPCLLAKYNLPQLLLAGSLVTSPSLFQVQCMCTRSPTISLSLNLPGAGFRVIKNALTPGGGSPLHCGGLKPATDPNRVRSGAQFLTVGRPHGSPLKSTNITIPLSTYTQHTPLSAITTHLPLPITKLPYTNPLPHTLTPNTRSIPPSTFKHHPTQNHSNCPSPSTITLTISTSHTTPCTSVTASLCTNSPAPQQHTYTSLLAYCTTQPTYITSVASTLPPNYA